jgi:hypothetical protein
MGPNRSEADPEEASGFEIPEAIAACLLLLLFFLSATVRERERAKRCVLFSPTSFSRPKYKTDGGINFFESSSSSYQPALDATCVT